MAQKPFGRILMEARERQGLDIDAISRQLRIRADILRAIEHNDFSHMPARGYARNMVNSYARLLGLNANAITNQYLHEMNEAQRVPMDEPRPERSTRRRSRNNQNNSSRRRPVEEEYYPDRRNRSYRDEQYSGRSSRYRNDDQYSDRSSRRQRNDQGSDRYPRSRRNDYQDLREEETISRSGRRVYDARNSTQYYDRDVPYEDSFIQRTDMRDKGFRSSVNERQIFAGGGIGKLPIIIGFLVIVVVLFIVITQVVGCVSGKSSNTNTSVPITGVSDTTNSGQNTENTTTETPPTSCLVQYTVPNGTDVWLEVYENNSETASMAQIVSGPSTAVFTVTGTWKLVSPSPTAVSVTVDGSQVELTQNSSGNYEANVDFAVILNQWAQTHKSSVSSNTSSTNSTNSTNSSNTNNTQMNTNNSSNSNNTSSTTT